MMEPFHPPGNPSQPSPCPSPCPSPSLLALLKARPGSKQLPLPAEHGSSALTWAAHLCHSFFSSCPASSAWVPLLHLRSRRGMHCGSHGLCPCCSSLFSAPAGIFGQLQSPGTQPQLPQLHTTKPAQSLGCKIQFRSSCLAPSASIRHRHISGSGTPAAFVQQCCQTSPPSLARQCPLPGASDLAPSRAALAPHSPPPLVPASRRNHQGGNGSAPGSRQCLPRKTCGAGEGRKEKVLLKGWDFRASSGPKLGLHFLCREVQDQFEERTRMGNATRTGAGFAVCSTHTRHSFPSGSRRNIQAQAWLGSLTMPFQSPKA